MLGWVLEPDEDTRNAFYAWPHLESTACFRPKRAQFNTRLNWMEDNHVAHESHVWLSMIFITIT